MTIGNCSETAAFVSATPDSPAIHLQTGPQVVRTVLIVPSLVEERKACHHLLAGTGRHLAAQGAAVLRFDPRGCGDAPGLFRDFSLASWQADLATAAKILRDAYPQVPQIWLGVRMGALLALQQAATASDAVRPEALVLWEPVTGPDFLRQLLQRRRVQEMMACGQVKLGRQVIEQRLSQGETVDFDGFPISGQLYRDLQQLQPLAWQGPGLILSSTPDTVTADNCHHLAPATTRLSLRLPPFWNTVGQVDTRALLEATTAWVGKQGVASGPHPAAGSDASHVSLPPPELAGTASTTCDGSERMVSFSGAQGTVRGVLHQPRATPRRGRILFLHGWSGDRTGPHRMFVHAARMLADRGFTSLRMDFGGRGDSDTPPSGSSTIADMIADARAAIDWLRTEAPADGPLTLLAICSGCKVAISTAAVEPDVERLALWSAESMGSLRSRDTDRRKRLAMLRAYAAKLLLPETWRKILRGQVHAGTVSHALTQAEKRSPAEARAEDKTLRLFQGFQGDILFIFGGSDPDAPGSSQAYARYCREHGIAHTCHTVPQAGHSFYGMDWEAEVLQTTAAWLAAC